MVVALLLGTTSHDRNYVGGFTHVVVYAVTVGLLGARHLLLPERTATSPPS